MSAPTQLRSHAPSSSADVALPWWALVLPVLIFMALLALTLLRQAQ